MSVSSQRKITFKPIISYPSKAQVGRSYLMTIDLQLTSRYDEWRYDDEEYPVWLILDTMPLFSFEPVGENDSLVVLHRFGGTYGPATFLLTARQEVVKGKIEITLVNRWGVAIDHISLPCEISTIDVPVIEAVRSGARRGERERKAAEDTRKDFFINHHSADRAWAEWIAWQLEEERYSVVLQVWDFQPGSDFVQEIDKATKVAERIMVLLSPDYLNALSTMPGWTEAFRKDPRGSPTTMLAVHVRECRQQIKELVGEIVFIDLVGLDESAVRDALLIPVRRLPPASPEDVKHSMARPPLFPGTLPSTPEIIKAVEIYISSVHEDERLVDGLEEYLAPLKGQGLIVTWRADAMRMGEDSQDAINTHLSTAQIILLLVSPDALASDYWYQIEMKRAMERYQARETLVIPIILRAVDWRDAPFGNIISLPKDARPITNWPNRDEAFLNVAQSIEEAVRTLLDQMWRPVFQQLRLSNPAAADLLRLCAFLHPNAIPREILIDGVLNVNQSLQDSSTYISVSQNSIASEQSSVSNVEQEITILKPMIASDLSTLEVAIAELLKISLLRQNPDTNTFSIDLIQQYVLKAGMDQNIQSQWAEYTVRAVNSVFPEVEFSTWHHCQSLLPHAQVCAAYIPQWNMVFIEATRLLDRAGYYLEEQAQYTAAEAFFQQAVSILEKISRPDQFELATTLDHLGMLYHTQGKYAEAEPLYLRALEIRRRLNHPSEANSLNSLATLYLAQGKYEEARELLLRALELTRRSRGHLSEEASNFNNLAMFSFVQGNYVEAEEYCKQALATLEQESGAEHPLTAFCLNNLAGLYYSQHRYEQAEALYQRALAIGERALGPTHPDVATILENYAALLQETKRGAEAAKLMQRGRAIRS